MCRAVHPGYGWLAIQQKRDLKYRIENCDMDRRSLLSIQHQKFGVPDQGSIWANSLNVYKYQPQPRNYLSWLDRYYQYTQAAYFLLNLDLSVYRSTIPKQPFVSQYDWPRTLVDHATKHWAFDLALLLKYQLLPDHLPLWHVQTAAMISGKEQPQTQRQWRLQRRYWAIKCDDFYWHYQSLN